MVTGVDFAAVRQQTKGMLHPTVYQAIAEAGKNAPAGIVVDIGPAQGGTTISLGVGRREAGLLTRIYSIDAFRGSNALAHKNDVEANKATLRANIEPYGLDRSVTILQAGVDDLARAVPAEPIAILSIDADGALDRDFDMFYDRLVPGAYVILDDYELKYDEKYVGMDDGQLAAYLMQKGVADVSSVVPLGKHFTVYRFGNYFIERGLLTMERVVRNTAFLRKPANAPAFRSPQRAAELAAIRAEIAEMFHQRRRARAAQGAATA